MKCMTAKYRSPYRNTFQLRIIDTDDTFIFVFNSKYWHKYIWSNIDRIIIIISNWKIANSITYVAMVM